MKKNKTFIKLKELYEICKKKKFVRFLFVGAVNTLFAYSVYALLLFLGLNYVHAVLISTISGTLFNFKTYGKLVFKNSKNRLIFKFMGVYTFAYFINIGCLRVFDSFKFNMYWAGIIMIMPLALVTFNLNKHFVFTGERK